MKNAIRASLILILLALPAGTAAIAQTTGDESTPAVEPAAPPVVQVDGTDATEVRGQLNDILRRYPPDLGRVLKLDPSLFANDSYMATYPALRAFVVQHPEIRRNPDFFLDSIYVPGDTGPRSAAMDAWENMMGGLAGLTVFVVITLTFTWFVRTWIEQKRWNRLSGVQQEVHAKLLDRFTQSADLLAYIQSPSGRKFLEAAPIPVDSASRSVSAPINRIFWSVQTGIVVATLGLGLELVTGRVPEELQSFLSVLGIVALSIGIGFVLSAVVSFILSRRLGLWAPPEPEEEGKSALA